MGERISHGSHLGSVLAVRHVLHRPVVAVRIVEVHEVAPRLFVDLAGVDAGREQLFAGLVDVGDDDLQTFTDPGSASLSPLPKAMEHADPGGVIWTNRISSDTT